MVETFGIPEFNVEHDGRTYTAELAVVRNFTLGREDHGIFTAMVYFDGGGWGQGISPMGLELGKKQGDDAAEVAMWCLDYIIRIVDTLGSPETAKGKRVVVFREGRSRFGSIVGFATTNPDGSYNKPFWHRGREVI